MDEPTSENLDAAMLGKILADMAQPGVQASVQNRTELRSMIDESMSYTMEAYWTIRRAVVEHSSHELPDQFVHDLALRLNVEGIAAALFAADKAAVDEANAKFESEELSRKLENADYPIQAGKHQESPSEAEARFREQRRLSKEVDKLEGL